MRYVALFFVRVVVPKPGIVMPMILSLLHPSFSYAMAVTRSASVLSRPPDMPIIAVLQPIWLSLFARPVAWMSRISLHLLSRSVSGANGYYIYRKTTTGTWTLLGKSTTGSYIDKTAQKGVTYVYTVRAYNGSVLSSFYSTGIYVKDVY